MKIVHIAVAAALALSFGLVGCDVKSTTKSVSNGAKSVGESAGDAAKVAGDSISEAAKATGNAIGHAAKATGEFLSPSKDSTIEGSRKELDLLEQKWKILLGKAEPISDQAKADLQKAQDQMARTFAEVKAMLAEAKDASGDPWLKTAKPLIDAALLQARKLYDDTAKQFGLE